MWGLFSRDPAKDFNYEIGEKLPDLDDKSLWVLHNGKKKGTGEPVSVFAFDVKGASEQQVQTAKSAMKRLKTLRHPNILTFIDGVETDKVIYFATEPVVPLETYLKNNIDSCNENVISWGLHQIVKGLAFLANDCNLIHNNVCMASVFVDPAGEWKLGGMDYMYPAQGPDSQPPPKILNTLQKYDPPEKVDGSKSQSNKWSADMWGLGCLVWEVFNGTLQRTASLKSVGKIPKNLVPNYCELVSANPKSRPNPANFLQDCCKKGGFMSNTFVETMLFLEEIQIKDQAEKNKFFAGLTPSLDTFPPQMCRNKILPQLLNAFEYGNAGSSILPPLFKIGKHLDSEEYQKKIVPCVIKLFSSPDRSTRVNLLQQFEFFVEHLSSGVVNDQIFPNVISGFMDTNPMVRESTVKAMLHMASKLNYKNLNEVLMTHFARLQSKDDQGGIRTNTTVCLGKIAGHLNPSIRQKILVSAFLRALKDPFPPARQAGILAMAATQNYYHMNEVACRLLPALCSMTRDPEKTVRDQAFKAIRGFLDKLEKLSEDPELQEDMEREVMAGGSPLAMSASGWAGWAVSGMTSLTSKIYSKAAVKPKPGPTGEPDTQSAVQKSERPGSEDWKAPSSSIHDIKHEHDSHSEHKIAEPETNEGWGDEDWGDIGDFSKSSSSSNPKQTGFSDSGAPEAEGWDDEDWGSLDDIPAVKTKDNHPISMSSNRSTEAKGGWNDSEFTPDEAGFATASQYNWGTNDSDFFSSVIKSNKPQIKTTHSTSTRSTPPRSTASSDTTVKTKPVASSAIKREPAKIDNPASASRKGEDDSGGDGWGNDSWDTLNSGSLGPETDQKKREREEKRQQRQKEMQEKREAKKGSGAMKLGAKKVG